MANETVIIDVIAKFKDKITDETKKAKKSVADFEKSVDNLSKKKASVRIDADTKKAKKSVTDLFKSVTTLSKKKNTVRLDADTKSATSGIKKVMSSAGAFAKRSYKSLLSFKDEASSVIKNVSGAARSFAGKVWKSTLSVVDKFTSPLTKLKNMLFSINTLITTVAAGLATKLVVAEPVQLADTITTSTLFFETKLGSKNSANSMMSNIMDFAKTTPFDTQGVIDGVKQMMAYGIETENVMNYMEKIGNVTSALGAGEAGIESITRALGQMKAAGRVNAQDMMQLTSVGVTGWEYIAKGMGKTVAEVREMSEDGALSADEAIKHIMNGLSEYDGMMEKMSNTTVKGLWSNIKDTFSQSIVLKWGKGLQKGAIAGLVSFRDWLDRIDPLLSKAGTSLESIGETISTKVFGVLDGLTSRFEKVANTDAFKNASLGEKIGIVWDEVIWQPFSEWWESKGKPKVAKKMSEFGETLGAGISNGLLALLGIDVEGTLTDGASIGASFADGFAEGFDGEKVGEALWKAIKKGFAGGAKGLADMLLPGDQGATGGQKIMGLGLGYAGLKYGPSLYRGGKGIFNTFSVLRGTKGLADVGTGSATAAKIIGNTGNAMVKGSGLSGLFSSAGYALTGGAATSTLSGGAAAAIGGGSILGGLLGGAGLISGGTDIVRGITSDNKKEKKTKLISGTSKVGMVGAGALAGGKIGALIGSAGGPIGTGAGALIGAGIGGAGALLGGDKFGKWLSDATDEGGSINKMGKSISKFFTETLPKKFGELWDGVSEFFTETIPSAIESASESITTFFTETIPEKWDEFWTGVGDFFTETIPYAIGYVSGKVTTFFTETLPEKWDEFWTGVGEFFDEVGEWYETLKTKVSEFFTVTLPEKWSEFWTGLGEFFTETIPTWAETTWNDNIVPFFTEDIPTFFSDLWSGIKTFFTETIPTWADNIWNGKIVPFFTEDIPGFFSDIWDSVTSFFTQSLPTIAGNIWGSIKGWFSSVKDWFGSVWESVKGSFSSGYGAGKGNGSGAANNATGGFVKGRTLSWLAEEGTPEVVIPLGSHRRDRAMSLWERTGELLGIKPEYNALGGIVGGNIGETPSMNAPLASYRAGKPGSVHISIGNITFEIKSGDNPTDILTAIKAQKTAIVEVISEALYEALLSQFGNTPMAAG